MASITSATSGLSNATGTWTGGVVPVSGDKVTIQNGHLVTLTGSHVWGDDTSTAITVNGVLKWSRSVSSSLTCRGELTSTQNPQTGSAAGIDMGTEADPIPAGVTASLLLNDSASQANGKWGASLNAGQFFRAWGATKKPWSRIITGGGVAAGVSSIQVDDATGWAAGDMVYVASTTDGSPGSTDYLAIQSVSGSGPYTVTFTAPLSFVHAARAPVANMTRNVVIRPTNTAFGAALICNYSAVSTTNINTYLSGRYEIGYVEFYCMGSTAKGGNTGVDPMTINGIDNKAITVAPIKTIKGVSGHNPKTGTVTSGTGCVMPFSVGTNNKIQMQDCVAATRNEAAFAFKYGVSINATGMCGISSNGVTSLKLDGTMGPLNSTISGGYFGGATFALATNVGVSDLISDCDFSASTNFLASGFGGPFTVDGCRIGTGAGNAGFTNLINYGAAPGQGVSQDIVIQNSQIQAYTRAQVHQNDVSMSSATLVKLYTNAGPDDYTQVRYSHDTYTDTSTVYRGTRSVKFMPYKASIPCTQTFTVPGFAGTLCTVVGYTRFNAAYGVATPPTVTLGGLGATTATFTAAATADTWQQFTLQCTPTSTGDLTLTVTGQSTDTTTAAFWLDGVPNVPFTPAARHFGYDWLPAANRTVDTSITVSEATALAYPVVVDHGAQTIAVTGDATARQVYEACMADLCATANQSTAKHVSTIDGGDTFTTTYEVIPQSGVTITGNYTDAAGAHVALTATLPAAGCRIQLYDVTGAVELSNQVVSGTSFTFPILYDTYSAGHLLRLRVAYQSGTTAKLPQEVFATLGASGATFTVPDQADTVYATNAVDGSTCTEFTADYPNLQIDVSDGDGTTSVQRIYAWSVWANTQADGIRLMFNAVVAQDELNYVIDQSVVNARFDNVAGTPVIITGGYIRRADGTTVIASTSGSIQMDPGRAYIATGEVPTAAQNATAVRSELTTELARLDVAVSTRLAAASYTAPPTAAENADKVLGRNLAGGADGGRTVQDALRASRNKTEISGSTLTVYAEDDTTPAWTATVTTAERDALSGIDPA